MPKRYELVLTPLQRQTLVEARSHHPNAYVRERAAALLKVADGNSLRTVAASGLRQPRRRETINAWIERSVCLGLPGLMVNDGRGRKPAFSPSTQPSSSCHERTAPPGAL